MEPNGSDIAGIVSRRARFFWFLGIALSLVGFFSWFTIAKEEDPRLRPRYGLITTIFPGADARQMNRLVVREIEKSLASVDTVDRIDATIRAEFTAIDIELKENLTDDAAISRAWDDVDDALGKAYKNFPQGAMRPVLDKKVLDQEAILIAFTGPAAERHNALIRLEEDILKLQDVSDITRLGDEGRQVTIAVNNAALAASGLTSFQLQDQIRAANMHLGAGSIDSGGAKINLNVINGFDSVAEINRIPVFLPGGGTAPLSRFATVAETDRRPETEEMRIDGTEASGLGVISRPKTDLIEFGRAVEKVTADFREELKKKNIPVTVRIINSQPEYVRERLNELAFSLLQSMGILAAVMLLLMGLRIGLLVTVMLPIISLISLALYAMSGGVLHQISVAAFVMSLGMLIDNVIVVTESIQEKKDSGMSGIAASSATIREFAAPLAASTITTIASFLPMALSQGPTAEFTVAIPMIAITTLAVSWVAAIVLTPSLSAAVLRKGSSRSWAGAARAADYIVNAVLHRPRRIAFGIGALLIAVILSVPFMGVKFFPSADRNQIVIEHEFPEGVSLTESKKVTSMIEGDLARRPDVKSFASFIGRSTPRFYYNLNQKPNAPHLVQILVTSKGPRFNKDIYDLAGRWQRESGGRVIFRTLEQGPPIKAPLELRIYGEDEDQLRVQAEKLVAFVKTIPGTNTVRHDVEGTGNELRFTPNDLRIAGLGLTRYDLAAAVLQVSRGIEVGRFRGEAESIPVVVTHPAGESASLADLTSAPAGQTLDRAVRVGEVTRLERRDSEAIIHRRNRQNVIRIFAQIDKGAGSPLIAGTIENHLKKNPLPAGMHWETGGETEESNKANAALGAALPLAMILLIATLLWEFNSYRLVMIIMTSVPLAALGIIPGLAIGRQPFGFLAMLAMFALIGIVVNNGIILIDRFVAARREGMTTDKAIEAGIRERLRPIVLTSGSTIMGMIPLTLTASTLWPPFAWSMISGLAVSTFFTLFIVPWMYRKFATPAVTGATGNSQYNTPAEIWEPEKKKKKDNGKSKPGYLSLLVLVLISPSLRAQDGPVVVNEEVILNLAPKSAAARAAWHEAAAARAGKNSQMLAAYAPKIGASYEYYWRDRDWQLVTPFGTFPFGRSDYATAGIEIYQTLWKTNSFLGSVPAASLQAEAAAAKAEWEVMGASALALSRYIDCTEIRERLEINTARRDTLKKLSAEIRRLQNAGRAKEVETVRVSLSLDEANAALTVLAAQEEGCKADLARQLSVTSIEMAPALLNEGVLDRPPAELFPEPVAERPDIRALRKMTEAIRTERDMVLSGSLPEIYAKGNYNYLTQEQFNPNQWASVVIGAKVSILDGGTQITERERLNQELKAHEARLDDAIRGRKVQLDDMFNQMMEMRRALIQSRQELELAERALIRENQRVASGRTTASDVLLASDRYWQRRDAVTLLRMNLARLYWGYRFYAGTIFLGKSGQ